ncbi:arabinofuranosidase catalytic domain-containing protein [Saccharicrinis sp. FJH62]|uniref:arabinofuranosidase catalytic domain-containing protein n=1 Tax=Saccharicrinis sp. FJH62 TaxID=3344657 RepID=UPI0035D4D3DC
MKNKNRLLLILSLTLVLPATLMMILAMSGVGSSAVPQRPEGPCDVYAAGDCPCVAAHSTTRALYASYNGPLYQVMRMSDGKTLDIGVVQPSEGDPGGYADAAAQDKFCADTYCWITILYDQSGKENHLIQAPRGGTGAPTMMGGFNSLPIADMAPVTLMGHKVYGIFIEPGMGLRLNDTKGTAVDDQAEGQYWVINGLHYNDGCCFDYGNAETDSRDDGDGTMETTYYGNAPYWYHGQDQGPWIMTDQENNLVGCVNPDPRDKYCADLPSISWRFVTATADGEPHHWRSMGGDAQKGDLQVMYDGQRIINDRSSYDPMRKQGAILLGNGGDNSNASQGTFYEAAMTAPGTFPSKETNQKLQANIVAVKYDVQRVSITPASNTGMPPGLQTFTPNSSQNTTVTFTNTTGEPIKDLTLSISVPKGWKSVALNSEKDTKKFTGKIAPGASVSATFTVTSGSDAFNGDLVGNAKWTGSTQGKSQSETAIEKVRNVSPVKINEFRVSDGSNSTNTFIELYNSGNDNVDISNWTLTEHATQMPVFTKVQIPEKTELAPHSFYLLGLSNSGLAVPVKKGESTIYVRSTEGMSVGDEVIIGTGSNKEIRRIAGISTPAEPENDPRRRWRRGTPGQTNIWQPVPDGPVVTFPAGSNSISVNSVDGFEVGQKMAIGYGAQYPVVGTAVEKYEVVTITKVGKPGTQAWLSMDAKAGDTNIKVSSVENISVGDKIRLDIDSEGHGIEWVVVKSVGTASSRSTFAGPLGENDNPGTGLELEEPLKFDHASNMPFSAWGTGISFEPKSKFDHSSNEPVLALHTNIKLDKPLANDHEMEEVVLDQKVTTAGYQGPRNPDQWFGGPALSSRSGSMVLRDAENNIVDGLNYGALVDPYLAEGYQAVSGAREYGCFAPTPIGRGSFRWFGGGSVSLPDISTGRYPDGADKDSNCGDFHTQISTSIAIASVKGDENLKVSGVNDFTPGQKVVVGSGSESEIATIALIGTAGGTAIATATKEGDTVVPVESVDGFSEGQTITIGSGANSEKAVVASVTNRRFRRNNNNDNGPGIFITVSAPLKNMHNNEEPVSGTGITFSKPLVKNHEIGTIIASNIPTPGEPNQY